MDEPRDDIDTWLQERVTPLLPHPGAFEQIKRRARRRKLGRAALAAAGAAVVVAGALTVPRLILSGGTSGTPTVASGATTPAHPSSPRPADRRRHLGARYKVRDADAHHPARGSAQLRRRLGDVRLHQHRVGDRAGRDPRPLRPAQRVHLHLGRGHR